MQRCVLTAKQIFKWNAGKSRDFWRYPGNDAIGRRKRNGRIEKKS
jgi:hypothetical protein